MHFVLCIAFDLIEMVKWFVFQWVTGFLQHFTHLYGNCKLLLIL